MSAQLQIRAHATPDAAVLELWLVRSCLTPVDRVYLTVEVPVYDEVVEFLVDFRSEFPVGAAAGRLHVGQTTLDTLREMTNPKHAAL